MDLQNYMQVCIKITPSHRYDARKHHSFYPQDELYKTESKHEKEVEKRDLISSKVFPLLVLLISNRHKVFSSCGHEIRATR